jgi:hypothetical protein
MSCWITPGRSFEQGHFAHMKSDPYAVICGRMGSMIGCSLFVQQKVSTMQEYVADLYTLNKILTALKHFL